MITRSIYIGNPAYLRLHFEQMEVCSPDSQEVKGRIAIEDMGLLMLDHYQITISHQLIQKLMAHNVVVISCDAKHQPKGMMYPLYGHSEHSERVKVQIEASEPLKKQLWKQTVEAKIKNQIAHLEIAEAYVEPMYTYLSDVKSGDTTNMEGIAAQHYWKYLIAPDFIRNRYGETPNPFLNFGYAVLRSIVARALVDTGLLPVLGIFHKNKYNPYCLADDIMEPYRPFVDRQVMEIMMMFPQEEKLTKEIKARLLSIATVDVQMDNVVRPLMVAVKMTVVSLYKCYTGDKRLIAYPEMI